MEHLTGAVHLSGTFTGVIHVDHILHTSYYLLAESAREQPNELSNRKCILMATGSPFPPTWSGILVRHLVHFHKFVPSWRQSVVASSARTVTTSMGRVPVVEKREDNTGATQWSTDEPLLRLLISSS